VIRYDSDDTEFWGLQFFDQNNTMILQAGYIGGRGSKELILEDGQRLIGVKSKLSG
jgi:hypothetical protein